MDDVLQVGREFYTLSSFVVSGRILLIISEFAAVRPVLSSVRHCSINGVRGVFCDSFRFSIRFPFRMPALRLPI